MSKNNSDNVRTGLEVAVLAGLGYGAWWLYNHPPDWLYNIFHMNPGGDKLQLPWQATGDNKSGKASNTTKSQSTMTQGGNKPGGDPTATANDGDPGGAWTDDDYNTYVTNLQKAIDSGNAATAIQQMNLYYRGFKWDRIEELFTSDNGTDSESYFNLKFGYEPQLKIEAEGGSIQGPQNYHGFWI